MSESRSIGFYQAIPFLEFLPMNEEDLKFIETEERLFQATVESLSEQLPKVRASKISANLEAREMTRQLTNVRNEEERQALASDEEVAHQIFDIRKENDKALLELIQEPYFGRVVTSEDDGREVSFLVGKKSNIEAGIVDWRNGPLSSLYFNYQEGEEFFEVINNLERSGRIKVRRSYRIESGKLVQIDTPECVFLRGETGWEKLDMDSQEAASRSRGYHSREKKLPNILSLITPDQFAMITTDVGKPVIIQGSAGSGKTTVALHRLAWLLHKENSPARPESTRVLMMNKSLQAYVVSTLPSMGIEGVGTLTFNNWAMSLIRQATQGKAFFRYRDLPGFIEEIKFSEEILNVLSAFVQRQREELDHSVRDRFMNQPEIMNIWQGRAPQEIIPNLREVIFEIESSNLRQEVKNSTKTFFRSKLMKLEDYVEDMYSLFTDSEFLLNNLNGKPKLQSHLKFLRKSTFRNKKDKCLDYFDLPLILRIIQLKNGGLPGKSGEVALMDHLVIDEAQDFGAVEFAVMINSVHDKSQVTIVGDVGQKILTSRKFIGWEKIIETLEMGREDLIRLEVSYRCTAPIMTLARKVEGRPKKMEGRPGRFPDWYHAGDKDDFLEKLAQWIKVLRTDNPNTLVALVCRYPKQARELKEDLEEMVPGGLRLGHREQFSFEPGVIVTNVHQVKGLEFDAVAVIEPSEEHYPHFKLESRNMLYVAVTRAQDDLLLIGNRPFTKILQ